MQIGMFSQNLLTWASLLLHENIEGPKSGIGNTSSIVVEHASYSIFEEGYEYEDDY